MAEQKHHLDGLNPAEKTNIRLSPDADLKQFHASNCEGNGLKNLENAINETRKVFNDNGVISDAKAFCDGVQGELQFRKPVTGKSPTP